MRLLKTSMMALSLALCGATVIAATPASAQAVRGIAVADQRVAIVNSTAFRTGREQRPVTYKPQIDQANARKAQIEQQLQPLVAKLQADAQQPNANQQALQQQYAQIQQLEQAGQAEINEMLAPFALSEQYVLEQLAEKLPDAVDRAMAKKGVTILLDAQAILKAGDTYNLNADITTELNALMPTAQLVPPPGWMPRQQREAAAAQAAAEAQAAGQPAPATAPQTEGR